MNDNGTGSNSDDDGDAQRQGETKKAQEMSVSLGPQVSFSSFHFLATN
jgi:hypothetical protein